MDEFKIQFTTGGIVRPQPGATSGGAADITLPPPAAAKPKPVIAMTGITISDLTLPEMAVSGAIVLILLLLIVTLIAKIRNRHRQYCGEALVKPRTGATSLRFAPGNGNRLTPYRQVKGVFFKRPEEEGDLCLSVGADSVSLMSEQNPSDDEDFESSQNHAVDPIIEAEVYMTYGRSQQAIQVLEEEYHRHGRNQGQIAIKLLEIYRNLEDPAEQDRLLLRFARQLSRDRNRIEHKDWAGIVTLVRKIDKRSKSRLQRAHIPAESHDLRMYDGGKTLNDRHGQVRLRVNR